MKRFFITIAVIIVVGAAIFAAIKLEAPTSPKVTESPYEITSSDNGKTFSYPITSRFSLILDRGAYPESQLEVQDNGILGAISNIPAVPQNLYAKRYEILKPGTARIKNGNFEVTINGKAS